MSVLYKSDIARGRSWARIFAEQAPDIEFHLWPETGNLAAVEYLIAWQPPPGLLAALPNLKVLFSSGAGVDQMDLSAVPPHVPVVRMVEPGIVNGMIEYVTMSVLALHRNFIDYVRAQAVGAWQPIEVVPASARSVGVMGLGVLGRDAALALRRLGFRVAGWSRTPKTLAAVETFHGDDGLDAFLRRTEILVCLLPATPATHGMLKLELIRNLKRDGAAAGAYLINAARGALQVDADILAALEEGSLAGATLDVFASEPLAPASPLWRHPKVTITPHNAAASDPRALVANVLRQIERFEAGLPLEHVVDRALGY